MFIFSYNDEAKVNPILKDRMYNIRTQGYERPEKTIISKLHLMPNICKQMAFKNDDVIIKDDIIHYIIDHYCVKQYNMEEKGVRNLKRCLEDVVMKLNLIRFVDNDKTDIVFPFDISSICAELPIKLTNEMISNLLKSSIKSEIPDFVRNLYS